MEPNSASLRSGNDGIGGMEELLYDCMDAWGHRDVLRGANCGLNYFGRGDLPKSTAYFFNILENKMTGGETPPLT